MSNSSACVGAINAMSARGSACGTDPRCFCLNINLPDVFNACSNDHQTNWVDIYNQYLSSFTNACQVAGIPIQGGSSQQQPSTQAPNQNQPSTAAPQNAPPTSNGPAVFSTAPPSTALPSTTTSTTPSTTSTSMTTITTSIGSSAGPKQPSVQTNDGGALGTTSGSLSQPAGITTSTTLRVNAGTGDAESQGSASSSSSSNAGLIAGVCVAVVLLLVAGLWLWCRKGFRRSKDYEGGVALDELFVSSNSARRRKTVLNSLNASSTASSGTVVAAPSSLERTPLFETSQRQVARTTPPPAADDGFVVSTGANPASNSTAAPQQSQTPTNISRDVAAEADSSPGANVSGYNYPAYYTHTPQSNVNYFQSQDGDAHQQQLYYQQQQQYYHYYQNQPYQYDPASAAMQYYTPEQLAHLLYSGNSTDQTNIESTPTTANAPSRVLSSSKKMSHSPTRENTITFPEFLAKLDKPAEDLGAIGWTVDQVCDWAVKNDVCNPALIREHAVDGKALLLLTQEDLERSFQLKLGQRVKFLDAVKALRL